MCFYNPCRRKFSVRHSSKHGNITFSATQAGRLCRHRHLGETVQQSLRWILILLGGVLGAIAGAQVFLAGLRDGSRQSGRVSEPRSGSRKSTSCQNEIGRVVSRRERRIKPAFCMNRHMGVDVRCNSLPDWAEFTSHALQHDVALCCSLALHPWSSS